METNGRAVTWTSAAALATTCFALSCGDSGDAATGQGGGGTSTTTISSTNAGGGTTGTGGQPGTGGSGTGGGGTGGTIFNPGSLVDDGLVARYLIAEADSGQAVTELVDAAPSPLAIPITYIPELTFAADTEGRRGLNFSVTNGAGRAAVGVDGTKVSQQIHASGTATIEVVADIVDIDNPAGFLFIGQNIWTQRLALIAWEETLVTVVMNDGGGWADFFVDVPAIGRTVYHGVLDTDAVAPEDRIRLYLNGARLTPIDTNFPTQGALIDLSIGNMLTIGNDANNTYSPEGMIFYVALYSSAFTDEQVSQNTPLLLYDDDVPSL